MGRPDAGGAGFRLRMACEAVAALLPPERRNPRGAGNALATLARHPDLAEAFLPFNTRLLLRSTLPPRLRELAILRVARRSGCAYEWAHHARIAAKAGLSEAEIEAAGDGKVIGPDGGKGGSTKEVPVRGQRV